MSLAGDFVLEDEYGHRGIEKALQINKTLIDGNEYRRKFDNATPDPRVNKTLYEKAKEILHDRSGTRYESMCWIDGDTGKVIFTFSDMGRLPGLTGQDHEYKVEYSDNILHRLRGYNNIIVLHNHPNSTAPSAGDFNSACDHGYAMGFVVTHDGRVFSYSSRKQISDRIYNNYWLEFSDIYLDHVEAQIKAIEKIGVNADITIKELFR
jgi:hypothetical protein